MPSSRQKIFISLGWAALVCIAVLALILYLSRSGSAPRSTFPDAALSMVAEQSDQAGISDTSSFLLHSATSMSQVSRENIKKAITISGQATFTADTVDDKTIRITPTTALPRGEVVRLALAKTSALADRDYHWSYQVKAPFALLSSIPGDHGNGVPVNTGIEMTFNHAVADDAEKFITITPKADGRFEVHGDTVVFIPKPLSEGTIYTVTIAKGLHAIGSQEALGKDLAFQFETAVTVPDTSLHLEFEKDMVYQVPGKSPTFAVMGSAFDGTHENDLGTLAVTVYRFPSTDSFIDSYRESRNWDTIWTANYGNYSNKEVSTKGTTQVAHFPSAIRAMDSAHYLEFPEPLKAGAYLVELATGTVKQYAWLQVSSLAEYHSVTAENGLIVLFDAATGKTVADSSVALVSSEKTKQLGKTDQDGKLLFPTPQQLVSRTTDPWQLDSKNDARPAFFRITSGNGSSLVAPETDTWGGRYIAPSDGHWRYLSTDRSLYRMTDTVHFWGIAKPRQGPSLAKQKIAVEIFSGYSYGYGQNSSKARPLITTTTSVSPFDTFTGSIDLPGLAPGTYTVQAMDGTTVLSSTSITVATYQKPGYGITLTPDREALFAGEPVIFSMQANFFEGTPVPRLVLACNWSSGNENNTSDVTLDDNGRGTLRIVPTYQDLSDDYSSYPNALNLHCAPKQAEEGSITAERSVLVFGPAMQLTGSQESYRHGEKSDDYTFRLQLNAIDLALQSGELGEYIGKGISNYGLQATLSQTIYDRTENGTGYDPINKTTYPIYSYTERTEELSTFSITTDENGTVLLKKNLPVLSGYYTLRVHGQDRAGRALKARITTYAFNPYWTNNEPSALNLHFLDAPVSDQWGKKFSIGEKVSLTATASGSTIISGAPVMLYRFGNAIDSAVVLNKQGTYDESFTTAFVPNAQYRALTLTTRGFIESNAIYASIKTDDRKLDVSLRPDKPSYRPGEKVNLDIAVQDAQKKAVSAEVNISGIDEALRHLPGFSDQPPIVDTLYQGIFTSPLVGYTQFGGQSRYANGGGAEKGGCFLSGTRILLPDGQTKAIEDIRTGDTVLTAADDGGTQLIPTTVQGTSSHFVSEILIINQVLHVTAEHTVFVNGAWKSAGEIHLGDMMLGSDGKTIAVTNIEKQKANHLLVHNIIVAGTHTYFADGFYVHNAEKGGGSGRSVFKDTVAFDTVTTDDAGKAKTSFTLSDDLTAWFITARAFSSKYLLAGQGDISIPVKLPLFVAVAMSDRYLVGDAPVMTVRVYGTERQDSVPITYTVKSPSLKLDMKQTVKTNTLDIPLPFFTSDQTGNHDITFSITQGDHTDTLTKKITIFASYFTQNNNVSLPITAGALSLQGNKDGTTTLLFTDRGQGQYYNALQNVTGGGVRSDQQVAALAASRMLHQEFSEDKPEDISLANYQRPDGMALLTYSDPELLLSAHIANLTPDLVSRANLVQYFRSALRDTKTDLSRSVIALYGLAALQEPVLSDLQALIDNPDLTSDDALLAALGLLSFGDEENARMLYKKNIAPHVVMSGIEAFAGWQGTNGSDETKRVKSTALLLALAAQLDLPDSVKLLEYSNNHYATRDTSVMENVLALRALLQNSSTKQDQTEAGFTIEIAGKKEAIHLRKGQTQTMTVLSRDLPSVRFTDIVGKPSVTSFFDEPADASRLTGSNNLHLSRAFFVNGKQTTTFAPGDVVKVTLTPTFDSFTADDKDALEGSYEIRDFLPSNLRPIPGEQAPADASVTNCEPIWYPESVMHNTVTFSLWHSRAYYGTCDKITISYYARVVSSGSFTVNPALMQSLRDPSQRALSQPGKVTVK